MLPILSQYKDNEYFRPNGSIDPSKKTEKYHIEASQWIYSLAMRNMCAWSYDAYNRFAELRAYSVGKQSTTKYQTWLTSEVSTNQSSTVATDSFDDIPLTRQAKKGG